MIFGVLSAVEMSVLIFLVVTRCGPVSLNLEAVCPSETLAYPVATRSHVVTNQKTNDKKAGNFLTSNFMY